jgi:hypothetical protein
VCAVSGASRRRWFFGVPNLRVATLRDRPRPLGVRGEQQTEDSFLPMLLLAQTFAPDLIA